MFHVKHIFSEEIKRMGEVLMGWGVDISEEKMRIFSTYEDFLIQWNKRVHLVSRGDEEKIVSKHFIESLALLRIFDFTKPKRMMDLGPGAGFPSIPLKILFPEIILLLVESNRKKYLYLKELIDTLELNNVSLACERIENMDDSCLFNSFDIITARTVAPIDKIISWTIPFLKLSNHDKNGGVLVIPYSLKKKYIFSDDSLRNTNMREEIVYIDSKKKLRFLLFYKKEI